VRALLGAQATTPSKAQAAATRGQPYQHMTGMQQSSCSITERPHAAPLSFRNG
jgi:hypothetical protein